MGVEEDGGAELTPRQFTFSLLDFARFTHRQSRIDEDPCHVIIPVSSEISLFRKISRIQPTSAQALPADGPSRACGWIGLDCLDSDASNGFMSHSVARKEVYRL